MDSPGACQDEGRFISELPDVILWVMDKKLGRLSAATPAVFLRDC